MSYVYFIGCEEIGVVKIGFTTKHPRNRISDLQTGCPFPLKILAYVPGSRDDERRLHAAFAPLALHGEWFRIKHKLESTIMSLTFDCLEGEPATRDDLYVAVHDCILAECAPHPSIDDAVYVNSARMDCAEGWDL